FRHDVCSAIHPSGAASPFFADIGLEVDWVHPPIPVAHPLDGGRAVAVYRSIEETVAQFGADANRYRRLMAPLADSLAAVMAVVLQPMTIPPRDLRAFARAGLAGGMP